MIMVGLVLLLRGEGRSTTEYIAVFVTDMRWYWETCLVLLGAWYFKSLRIYLAGSRITGFASKYCEVYDILSETQTSVHVAFIVLIFLGYNGYLYCYGLLLFDIMNMSVILANVLRAIIRPIQSLLLTFWLFIIVIYVYTGIGLQYFGDLYVNSNDDGAINPCPDFLTCMVQAILVGFAKPEEQNMEPTTYKEGPKYYGRIFFDLTFFIILGVLLFNMVT